MQHVGIREIAEKANVSVGTVDRVIHNRGRVSETTRQKVLRICKELNYHPNFLAQRLAAGDPVVLASLIPEFTRDNTYWELPMEGIFRAARELAGYKVNVDPFFFTLTDPVSFRKAALDCLLRNPDGILLAPIFKREAREFVQKCEEKKIPYVFIDASLEDTSPVSAFCQNPFNSGYIAGRLLSFHLKRKSEVVVVNFSVEIDNNPHLKKREEGLRAYFKDHRFEGNIVTMNIKPPDELLLTSRFESTVHHKTTGLFVTSSAHKVARSIEKLGRSKMMVVGYDLTPDNVGYLEKGVIDILLCQKPYSQGYKGMMALFDHVVRKKKVAGQYFLPVDIVLKENYIQYKDI